MPPWRDCLHVREFHLKKISAEFFGASEGGRGEKPSHVSLNNLQTRKEGEKKPMKREGGSRFAKYG